MKKFWQTFLDEEKVMKILDFYTVAFLSSLLHVRGLSVEKMHILQNDVWKKSNQIWNSVAIQRICYTQSVT